MGKLIVFEGTDGSGKSTQFDRLTARLASEGRDFRRLRFPQYDEPSSTLIRMYLNGDFGSRPGDVNAYAASTFYAVDRYASFVQHWGEYYRDGGLVLADRYTTSNAVHQGGKLPEAERPAFLEWLYDLEYRRMGLPRPDLVLCMEMPIEVTLELMRSRGAAADIHERDAAYLASCREMALEAAAFYGWTVVHGARDGRPRPVDEVAAEIYEYVQNCLKE